MSHEGRSGRSASVAESIGRQIEREEARRRLVGVAVAAMLVLGIVAVAVGVFALRRPAAPPTGVRIGSALTPAPASSVPSAPAVAETSSDSSPAGVAQSSDATIEPPAETPEPAKKAAPPAPQPMPRPAPRPQMQRFAIRIGGSGYEPAIVTAEAGSPITLEVGKGEGCAAGFLMPSLGIAADNSRGTVSLALGTLEPGSYQFTCGMEMVGGELVVR